MKISRLVSVIAALSAVALAGACGGGNGNSNRASAAESAGAPAGSGTGNGGDAADALSDLEVCGLLSLDDVADATGADVKIHDEHAGSCTFGPASDTSTELLLITLSAAKSELAGDLETLASRQAEFAQTESESFDGLSTDAYTYSLFGSAVIVFATQGHAITLSVTGTDNPPATAEALAQRVLEA